MEPYIQKAQKHPEVHTTGKSSVGTTPLPASFRLQAPEFNRIELIERSDVLFINRFSLLPYKLVCDMVKKSKHVFAASYPDLTTSEISNLVKLATEARSVIQIVNPYYYLPGMQWLVKKQKKTAYIQVSYFNNDALSKNNLLQLLLMLKDFTGTTPRKTAAVMYCSTHANAIYQNLQLDYNDGSTININLGTNNDHPRFQVNLYMQDYFAEFNFIKKEYIVNNQTIDPQINETADETNDFLNAVIQKRKAVTDLENYSDALQVFNNIQEKLDRFNFS